MRLLTVLLCTGLPACQRAADKAPASYADTVLVARESAVAETPLWKFGEASGRRDSLPAALDTMNQWGDYDVGERPVAFATDLNGDGSTEWFIRAASRLCGQAGCPLALVARAPNGAFVDLLGGCCTRYVYVTNNRVRGWPVLWLESGGSGGGLNRLTSDGARYRVVETIGSNGLEWTAQQDSLAKVLQATPLR
jgi:hypothetical protein